VSAAPAPTAYREIRFGRFCVDVTERSVRVDGEPAKLGARAFDILLALVQRRERVVGKNELLEIVWPNLVVEENNLQVHISALRKLFGAEVIATMPGRGYRFAARLEEGLGAALGEATPAPAPAPGPSARAAATNLPEQALPLFGRDADLDAVRRLVEEHRLVTIVGAGGIGKTRVGHAVAHALRGRWPDGAWLVELAPLADAALLTASVAHALGLHLRGVRELRDELVEALLPQHLVLLLDNCEHLVEAVSQLAQLLLIRTPHVRLLVTSQEPLRLPAEHVYRLGTLAVPPPDASPALALEHGAVRLLVERVQALDPRFVLDERNAAAVVDIARHLDGLALAIELAAARVPALGVEGVRERLGARLHMLTAGSRIALRRYQTLRAALDWSHGLLDADEQAVFRRLGIFSGGCTIEAVQQVASDERLDEWAVLDIVARLVDKSLLVADGDDRPRYRLLESARAYALEKLAAAGETDALTRRHAAWYAGLLERLVQAWYDETLGDDGWLAARALELDNLRAALAWALGDSGDVDIALALLAHSAPLSLITPLDDDAERWFRVLSKRLQAAGASARRLAWTHYAELQWRLLRLRTIVHGPLPVRLEPTVLQPLDERRQAHALYVVALHATWIGDLALARTAVDAARDFDCSRWAGWMRVLHLQVTIRVRHLAGDTTSAAAELRQVLAQLDAAGQAEARSAFIARTDVALDALVQGHFDEACQRLEALADLGRRQRRDPLRMSVLTAHWALALAELGRLEEAHGVVREALPYLRRTGLWGVYAPVIALVAAGRGELATAARLLGAGDAQLVRSGLARSLLELRAATKVIERVADASGREQLDAWIAEGSELGESTFERLALGQGE
jgi:predicted ATPase/DNA-binding winged helix-turn-helix (wHTH) protein